MTATVLDSPYRTLFDSQHGQAWIQSIRTEGFNRFAGMPTMDQEAWRYTSFRSLERTKFVSADSLPPHTATIDALPGASRVVFVDGRYNAALSKLPEGATPLFETDRTVLEAHLAASPGVSNPFVALNQAFLREGVLLSLSGVLEAPLHVLHVATGRSEAYAAHPRVVLLMGENSQATVLESFVSLQDGVYFQNPVVDAVLQSNAVLHYYKIQQESLQAFHVGAVQVWQADNSTFSSHFVSLGGGLVRQDISVLLGGPGANCTLNGLALVAGTQHVDNATFIDHAVPNCGSQELYKTILDDKATAGFTGKVLVRQDAQKTDAHQTNRNLLLSTDAVINTRPQLQIYADDVKCTHGAAVGQLDANALFYLVSRGIDTAAARGMLTYAFGSEVVDNIPIEAVRDRLQAILWNRLSIGERL